MEEGREQGAFVRFVAMSGLMWLAASAAAIALHVVAPGSAWQDETFPAMARVSLIGLEIFLLAYPCALVTLPVYALLGRPDRPGSTGWPRVARVGVAVMIVVVPVVAYAASWAIFRSTGQFLNHSMLVLWWSNPVQMAQHTMHMEPRTPVLVGIGTLVFAGALVLGLRGVRGYLKGWLGWSIAAAAVILVPASLFLPGMIGWEAVDGFMRARRAHSSGPLLVIAADYRFRSSANADPIFRAATPVVESTPIISMDRYLADAASAVAGARRLNVLIVVIESLRSDQLTTFGGNRVVMPTVDGIADSALRFTRHYTQASHSDYADPTILSSHYPLRSSTYHVYPKSPPYPRVLIYDVLAPLGYRVGIFSSQNESWGGMKYYLDTGSVDRFLHSETYDGPTYVPDRDEGFAGWVRGAKKSGKIDDRFTVDEAIRWIDEDDEPFVIYMNLQNSHIPYVIPADFDPPYGAGRISFTVRFGSFPQDSVKAVRDLYASSLAYVDAQLGRLMEYLARVGRLDDTIIVITSDTGQAFYEHGFASHASALYDEVMRVPLLIRAPGLDAGERSALSEHVDIPPTILGLLGLPPHPSFQGVDLLGAASGKTKSVFLVGQALREQYAVVDGRWKLIFDADFASYELYDLEADPGELHDLATERADVVARLGALLHGWRKAQIDYYRTPDDYRNAYPPRLLGVRMEGVDGG